LRRDLGRKRQTIRVENGRAQTQLVRKIGYIRRSVSSVKSGGNARRYFFGRCNEALQTGRELAQATT
jgi:hypothetical protein